MLDRLQLRVDVLSIFVLEVSTCENFCEEFVQNQEDYTERLSLFSMPGRGCTLHSEYSCVQPTE